MKLYVYLELEGELTYLEKQISTNPLLVITSRGIKVNMPSYDGLSSLTEKGGVSHK